MSGGRAGLLALSLACAAALAPGLVPAAAGADPAAALAEGNRRFRGGDLEGAFAAYAAGYDPERPDPLLAYNLGATAHRLGRLPEAVLWYRRARGRAPFQRRDLWLADNLALARSELAAPRLPARGGARWAAASDTLLAAGCLLAWAALAAELVAGRRGRAFRRAALGLGLIGAALYAAGWLTATRGPQPAVLLARCGELPAGSEVWVRQAAAPAGGFRLAHEGPAAGAVCPTAAVGLVSP